MLNIYFTPIVVERRTEINFINLFCFFRSQVSEFSSYEDEKAISRSWKNQQILFRRRRIENVKRLSFGFLLIVYFDFYLFFFT